jgi:two-component system sensor histidine kinase PilS (NtrC family)
MSSGERRRGDRRSGDRRNAAPVPAPAPAPAPADESWFGALGVGDTKFQPESFFDPGWVAAGDHGPDSRFLSREARRIAAAQDSALARVYRTYAAARAIIGAGLVAAQVTGAMLGVRASVLVVAICVLYAAQAIALWLLPRLGGLSGTGPVPAQGGRRQWLSTIGVDLLVFGALHVLEAASTFNFAALLVLPVLMGGVLTQRLRALGTAAGVTLLLLLLAWWRASNGGTDGTTQLLQAGLAGLGLFVIALLAGELAGRLAREELAARGSLELARQQAQLNRLVIEEMVDGVLVVDRRLRVRAANPAARALLVDQGLSPPAPFTLDQQPEWAALAQAVERALADSDWPEAGRDVTLDFAGSPGRTLRMRVRFMRHRALDENAPPGEPLAVLLLEDVRTAQARLRQEKLAAMGRVSAGIAHEIRNPLAAIAQANALMMEDELAPAQQRLARMVAANVERLRRLVDDVMEVAPGVAPQPQPVDAAALVAETVTEWARTASLALGTDSRLRMELPTQPLRVVFDAEHLRRVLVNLLDNARRHASTEPGAIFLGLAARDDALAQLSVHSDGSPIRPEVERHLFEPFFSTRSRGSGLGLYICRELCERYGASIEYRARPASERLRNEFVVTLRRVARSPADETTATAS